MKKGDVYALGKNLAFAQKGGLDTGSCVLTAENVPPPGINGSFSNREMAQLREHGCFVGGGLSLDDDNGPYEMEGFTVKDVEHAACSHIPQDAICESTKHGAQSSTTSDTISSAGSEVQYP